MSNETNWLEIKKEYLRRTVDGEKVKLSELAEEFGVKYSTLRSRKNREKWDEFLDNVATQLEKRCNTVAKDDDEQGDTEEENPENTSQETRNKTNRAKNSIKRSIGQLGNKNAVGNCNAPPKGNKRAEKHGFYSKYLPDETMDLFDDLENVNQLELLWDSIKLKYAAIIRAQKIMYVKDREDITAYLKKHKVINGMSFTEEKEWEIQFAWDKYATFLNAQSRAMAELRSLIKSYNELVDRGMGTKEQELRVQRLQLEIDKISGDDTGQETQDWVKAIEEIAAKRRGQDE